MATRGRQQKIEYILYNLYQQILSLITGHCIVYNIDVNIYTK